MDLDSMARRGRSQGYRVITWHQLSYQRRSRRSRLSFSSFPHSVWERTSAKLRFAHRVQVPTAWRNRSFAEGRSQTEFGNEATMAATGHFGPRSARIRVQVLEFAMPKTIGLDRSRVDSRQLAPQFLPRRR